ncbi:MAG: 12-oxophytodienoate reductase, partial [Parvibaculaceae bacterium]|nr:12-oxophytodienoate reductase [Parvibaculaceae bacterium]
RFWEPEFDGSDLNLAGWTGKLTGKPTMTVGSIGLDGEFIAAFGGASSNPEPGKIDELVQRFENGEFDMAAVGRALIVDPEWVNKVRDGRFDELLPFAATALGELA